MSEVPPPDPTALLRLLRDDPPAPPDARVRVRARLAATLSGGGGGGGGGAPSGPSRGPRSGGAGGGALSRALSGRGFAAVAFLAGGVVGAAVHAALTHEPAPRVLIQETVAAAHVPAPAAPRPSAEVVELDDAPVPAARAPVVPPPSSMAPGPSQLAAERAALDEARAQLVRGDPASALRSLQRAARRFPHPVLGEECDALTIEALVGVRRYDEARALATSFHARSPESLFTATVASAIRAIPAEASDGGGEP